MTYICGPLFVLCLFFCLYLSVCVSVYNFSQLVCDLLLRRLFDGFCYRRIARRVSQGQNVDEYCLGGHWLIWCLSYPSGGALWALCFLLFREIDCGNWLARGCMPAHQHCNLFYPLGWGSAWVCHKLGNAPILRSRTGSWLLRG